MSNHMKTVVMALNGSEIARSIDWDSALQFEPNMNFCSCGAEYRSHYRVKSVDGKLIGITRVPCPSCGQYTNVVRSATPPEYPDLKRVRI